MKFQTILMAFIATLSFSASHAADLLNGPTMSGEIGNMSADVKIGDLSGKSTSDAQHAGLKLGYASIANNELGYIVRATFGTKVSGNDWDDYCFLRPEMNLALGFAETAYAFAGMNLNSFQCGNFKKLDLGKGFQVGGGVRISPSTFVDLQYITTNHELNTAKISLNSIEISIGTTF